MEHGTTLARIRSTVLSRSIMPGAAAVLTAACVAPRVSAQNLLQNASFESALLSGNYPLGKYSMIGPDSVTISPWTVLPGGLADVYFPMASGAKSIIRAPHGVGVLGFPPMIKNWGVLQTLTPSVAGVGTFDSGQYLFVADIAGDRGTDTLARTDTLGCDLVVNGSSSVYGFPTVLTTPALAGDPFGNTARNSVFSARVVPLSTGSGTYLPINGTFRLWNSGNTGMLVDAAHLIRIYGYRPNCDPKKHSLKGFSVLESETWLPSSTNSAEPLWDLLQGTTQGCDDCVVGELFADSDALTLNSGQNCKSTLLLVGLRVSGSPTLTLTLETEGVTANSPAFSVSFYDYVKQQWSQPKSGGGLNNSNAGKPYPGGKVGAAVQCRTIDWSVYNLGAPLSNYAIPAQIGDLVLAKVVFENGCGTWVCPTNQSNGTTSPPCEAWQFRLHFAGIEFN